MKYKPDLFFAFSASLVFCYLISTWNSSHLQGAFALRRTDRKRERETTTTAAPLVQASHRPLSRLPAGRPADGQEKQREKRHENQLRCLAWRLNVSRYTVRTAGPPWEVKFRCKAPKGPTGPVLGTCCVPLPSFIDFPCCPFRRPLVSEPVSLSDQAVPSSVEDRLGAGIRV